MSSDLEMVFKLVRRFGPDKGIIISFIYDQIRDGTKLYCTLEEMSQTLGIHKTTLLGKLKGLGEYGFVTWIDHNGKKIYTIDLFAIRFILADENV